MKKFFIPAAFAMSLLASCNVLDKEPLTTIAPSNFFKSATDAEASLTAAYDGLQSKGCYAEVLNLVGNMPSDDCTSNNNDVRALDDINWNSSTGQVGDAYRDNYRTINRANSVIKYVPGVAGMNATRRDQILGEARFLRALSYFNLVRLYGPVPLRLEPTETGDPAVLNLPRAATDQVYARIVEDLTIGAGLMADVNPARATKGSANALLARVQLTQRNWSAAKDAALLVLGGKGGYSLQGFNSLFPADNKSESIFEIQFSGSADGGTSFTLPDLLLPLPAATYSFAKFNLPTLFVTRNAQPTDLTSVVDTINDQRWSYQGNVNTGRNHASYVQGLGPKADDSGPFVYKWRSDGSGFNSSDNYYVLRLAEVYLTAAEASNELNSPAQAVLDYLNPIRQRAGLLPLDASSPEAASQATLRTEIDKQRRLELAFEGERWFDLIRYARHTQANSAVQHAVTALDMIAQKRGTRDVNYLLFPIPLGELNTNTQLQQNPGY
ncbi:RagB/SusD family nutrient uptake outer membrane protein [Microvirga sp. STS02]|uniref:RagB/SusD family nutrient uptake outer membrane protein n=1 Tax=Hymenobacter negativus TaxID=2795026 RepID=UPI0018DD0E36|nr:MULTISPECIES: RagB/SusD family nutrient uptake outer membrane protein [Bacteria]MBH8567337.1 RagB/SusD family nutrient uptake outer membrane protein [Hymenobacter negativus]MBR7207069.1 RagB/SusD family nutrient uptake outer membrane protein [Microvirga sp. STS02]